MSTSKALFQKSWLLEQQPYKSLGCSCAETWEQELEERITLVL
jgi:hypothetical protein